MSLDSTSFRTGWITLVFFALISCGKIDSNEVESKSSALSPDPDSDYGIWVSYRYRGSSRWEGPHYAEQVDWPKCTRDSLDWIAKKGEKGGSCTVLVAPLPYSSAYETIKGVKSHGRNPFLNPANFTPWPQPFYNGTWSGSVYRASPGPRKWLNWQFNNKPNALDSLGQDSTAFYLYEHNELNFDTSITQTMCPIQQLMRYAFYTGNKLHFFEVWGRPCRKPDPAPPQDSCGFCGDVEL